MSLIIPRDLVAYDTLSKEGVSVIDSKLANRIDGRVIEIAIVNLMPTKEATETQLLRLVANVDMHIKVTLVYTSTYLPTHVSKEYLDKCYKRFDEIKNKEFDGLIITGAPVENIEFEQVKYWEEFEQIVEFSKTNVNNVLYICWGAQAGLYSMYGIKKKALPSKLFGIFKAYETATYEPLLDGIDKNNFYIPNSRHTTLFEDDIDTHVKVLARTDEGGVAVARSFDSHCFFLTGHSEYDIDTLKKEYLRDLSKGLPIEKPVNYFVDVTLDNIDMKWKHTAQKLFSNWINFYVVNDV